MFLYLRRKSFLKPPGGSLCVSITTVKSCGRSRLLTRLRRRASAKGIILYHVVIPSSSIPPKGDVQGWEVVGWASLNQITHNQNSTNGTLQSLTMDLLTQGWELRPMKQVDGFRTNYVQRSRTSPNTQPFFTSFLCKVAWKIPPSGHLHAHPGTHVPHPHSK